MAQKKTPLIQKLRKHSGTIYVFPSASEDVGLNLNSDINGAAITHYALLNIPSFKPEKWMFHDQYKTQFEHPDLVNFIPALSLQNYMMNMETVLLNNSSYDFQRADTVTERVFWHWLTRTEILQPADASKLKSVVYNGKTYYYEPDRINNIVKCFGQVDAGNSLSAEFGIFNETYINIPSSYGGGPVFFESKKYDINYQQQTYNITDEGYLEGRVNIAQYVSYSGNNDTPWADNATDTVYDTTGDKNNGFEAVEIVKDIAVIRELLKLVTNKNQDRILSYDDINIDPVKTLSVNDADLVSGSFDFNAILLYYSIYDQNDSIKKAQATNLFGIIFLDGVTVDSTTQTNSSGDTTVTPIIKGLHKRKTIDSDFGTSYSFRVNVKTMSIYDNSDAVIQDNTTISSINAVDFSGAVSQLNRAVDIMNMNVGVTQNIQNSYAKVLSYYDRQARDIYDISVNVQNMLNGKVRKSYTLESLYCNSYYNVHDPEHPENSKITFYLSTDQKNEDGSPAYITENRSYAMMLDHYGLHTHTAKIATSYHQKSYRLINKGIDDYPIWSPPGIISPLDQSKDPDVRLEVARGMLEKMFETSTMLRVKLYHDPHNYIAYSSEETQAPVLNYLYIDEASQVFDASSNNETICVLKDSSTGFIDYVGMVPYMVAQLQRLHERFKYEYSLNNSIYGIEDVHTMKDALDFLMNIFHYEDMQNYASSLVPVLYEAVYNGTTWVKGAQLNQEKDGEHFFYKGQRVIIEFHWKAAEPNNNMLAAVELLVPVGNDNANLLNFDKPTIDVAGIIWKSPSGDIQYIVSEPYHMEINKELSDRIDVEEYSGYYYVEAPNATLTTQLTLKSKVTSETARKLTDKVITATVKCIVKCFYWTSTHASGTVDAFTPSQIDIYIKGVAEKKYKLSDLQTGNAELVKLLEDSKIHNPQYFEFEDRITRLPETMLNPQFKEITDDEGNAQTYDDMYIYFLLPYYEGISYDNVHVYADIDVGVGGYEKYNNGRPITLNIGGIATNYVLYRTSQMQNNYINIKIG